MFAFFIEREKRSQQSLIVVMLDAVAQRWGLAKTAWTDK